MGSEQPLFSGGGWEDGGEGGKGVVSGRWVDCSFSISLMCLISLMLTLPGAEPHLNTCFKHYMYFVYEFNLIPKREELAPLQELIDKLLERDSEAFGAARAAGIIIIMGSPPYAWSCPPPPHAHAHTQHCSFRFVSTPSHF